ncbi:putative transcription initiation factor IIF, alpha subunit [Helianthus annuus]|nr:putative transcription initiation factor IIF, alpha subunit [Helianthus annuus]
MFILKGYEEDQEDNEQKEGGLSQSGKELRKLLGKNSGVNESEPEQEDDDDDADDIEYESSPVLAPKANNNGVHQSVITTLLKRNPSTIAPQSQQQLLQHQLGDPHLQISRLRESEKAPREQTVKCAISLLFSFSCSAF